MYTQLDAPFKHIHESMSVPKGPEPSVMPVNAVISSYLLLDPRKPLPRDAEQRRKFPLKL